MQDLLLTLVFDPRTGANKRWCDMIQKGVDKQINRKVLLDICEADAPSAEYLTTGKVINRMDLYLAIRDGKYRIAPPHTAEIPKEGKFVEVEVVDKRTGEVKRVRRQEMRTVYINTGIDRLFLGVVNQLLFDLCKDMIHPSCSSYQKGIGCAKVVREIRDISEYVGKADGIIGVKSDLRKYFDNVQLPYIERCFDQVEQRIGHSVIIDVLREYYRSDAYYVKNTGRLAHTFQSLKQGCAVASFLADAILYDLDKRLAEMPGCFYYNRYCDDQLYIGEDWEQALQVIEQGLAEYELTINRKKLEYVSRHDWFVFLGYAIRGNERSLSDKSVKHFQHAVEQLTIKCRKKNRTLAKVIHSVMRELYVGDGKHSWATWVLRVINNEHDIDTLNEFVMDAIRATMTGRRKIGGLGYDRQQRDGCIARGRGRNVTSNRGKTDKLLTGWLSVRAAQHALQTDSEAFRMLVRDRMATA